MTKYITHPYFPHFLILVACLLTLNAMRFGMQTIQAYTQLSNQQQKLAMANEAGARLQQQQLQLKQLSLQAQQMQAATVEIKDHLSFVFYLEQVCKKTNVHIVSHPKESTEQVANFAIADERFSLEGKLTNLLRLIYQIEHQDRVGTLVHTELALETHGFGQNRKHLLLMHVQLKRLNG